MIAFFLVAAIGGLTNLSHPGHLPPRGGGGDGMVVAPSEQNELQNPESLELIHGREQSLRLHLDLTRLAGWFL